MAFLRANNGPDSGKKFELVEQSSIMGRHPECQIVVDVGAVSRQHCKIELIDKSYQLSDLESRNGTFINQSDQRLTEPHVLRSGDVVRICDVSFTFFDGDGSDPASGTSWPPNSGNSSQVLIEEDEGEDNASTIMSKLDVSADSQRAQVTATPQVKLKALIDIAHSLRDTLSLDEVLPRMLDSLFQIFLQADRGFIVLKGDNDELIPMWTKIRRDPQNQAIRISRTIIQQVMTSRQAILSADAASDERFDLSQSVADFKIRSMMCAPLIDSNGVVIGVLQVDTLDQNKRFNNEDLEVLAMVGLHAGIAIDNARMHDEALQQKAMQRELELAQQVQSGFLPEKAPSFEGYEFHDYYQPAHHVGGDYFDYIQLPDGRWAIVVADVVGHGIAASLLMAKLSAEVRWGLALEPKVSDAMARINRAITLLQLNRFVTMVLVVLEPSTGQMVIGNAGHTAPLCRRNDGSVEELGKEAANLPLGIEEEVDYGQATSILEPGEIVLLWTDGIHEIADADNVQFGHDRLRGLLAESTDLDPKAIGRNILDSVHAHRGDCPTQDDMCLVCFGRK